MLMNCLRLLLTLSLASPLLAEEQTRILFGSCAHQDKALPILDAINKRQRDVFVFLGDNIYGDTEDMQVLKKKYAKLGAKPGFRQLRERPVIAIWDDHDYGENDAGAEYPMKEQSRQIMLDFWGEAETSPRRSRKDGIYTSYVVGEGKHAVRIILPDLRWNRSPINSVSREEYRDVRKPQHRGPYQATESTAASMLGEAQWRWLEQELRSEEPVKIIASSLQLLADFTGWEAWVNYPHDRQRLFDFIRRQRINGVMIISGDTHWGELSRYNEGMDYPLWEVTSSGLSEEWKHISPNKHRIGAATSDINFGELTIDWQQKDPLIRFGLRDVNGDVINQMQLRLSTISPYK
jgi:alkaline phosphatase D